MNHDLVPQSGRTLEEYCRHLFETLRLTEDDQALLRRVHGVIGHRLAEVTDEFYRQILAHPHLRTVLGNSPQVLSRLRNSFGVWLGEVLLGPHDHALIERHLRIGDVHRAIGLETRYVLSAVHHVRMVLCRLLDEGISDRGELRAAQHAVDKVLSFEEALLTDSYYRGHITRLVQEGEAQIQRFARREELLLREMTAAQEGFARILQNPITPIFLLDRAGNLVVMNEAAERPFGFSDAGQTATRQFTELLVAQDDRGRVADAIRQVVADERIPSLGFGGVARSGARLDLVATLFLAQGTNGEPQCVVLALDVTEQSRLREELDRAERLATIGRLAAMVAHEVGTPLAGMQGVLEIVRARLPHGEERELLGKVLVRTGELAQLIRDLLVMSRPVEVHLVQAPLATFFREVLQGLDPDRDLLDCGVTVKVEPPGLTAAVDPVQLRRALTNLLLNAAQATGRNGCIVLSAHPTKSGREAVVEVEDNGPGIADEALRQMFTPFFTTKKGGTGLGLCITREIVRKHGGRLIGENATNGGARFRIVLPR